MKTFFSVSLFFTKANFGQARHENQYIVSLESRENMLHMKNINLSKLYLYMIWTPPSFQKTDAFLCIYETNVSFFATMCKMEQNISLVTEKHVLNIDLKLFYVSRYVWCCLWPTIKRPKKQSLLCVCECHRLESHHYSIVVVSMGLLLELYIILYAHEGI